ncbi:hypothetical protein [Streptosporangium roseum]|uniref:hypothetical protein n=1 Tax=Streptosporangium roseum TaxID=2001 RepID=UPI003321FFEE
MPSGSPEQSPHDLTRAGRCLLDELPALRIPLPAGSRRDRKYCNNNCRTLAWYYRRKSGELASPRWQHPALTSDNTLLRAAADHAVQLAEAHGWSGSTTRCTIDGLARPAFRFDKTPESYLAGLHLRGAIVWLRNFQPI